MDKNNPLFYENKKPEKGDILAVQRKNAIYIHYGIYVGDNQVVHFSGPVGDDVNNPENVQIRKTSLEDFLRGDPLKIQVIDETRRKFTPEQVVQRALDNVGKSEVVTGKYNFVMNNCEHFATWCVYGRGDSHQIHKFGQMGADISVKAIDLTTSAINFFKEKKFAKRVKEETKNEKLIANQPIKEIKMNEVSEVASFCPKCGNKAQEGDLFCRKCGGSLK